MTGQLFVVPADAPGGPVRPPRPGAGGRPGAAVPRHPQVRQGRPVRARPGHRRARRRGRWRGRVRGDRAGAARRRRSRCATSARRLRRRKGRLKPLLLDQSFLAGVGNIYADEALWRVAAAPAAVGVVAAAARRAPAVRGDPGASWPRRSSAAARRSTTTRRPTATARCRSGSTSTSAPASPAARCGRPIKRIVIGARSTHFCSWCQRLPAADRKGARGDPADDHAAGEVRRGRRWTELAAGRAASA